MFYSWNLCFRVCGGVGYGGGGGGGYGGGGYGEGGYGGGYGGGEVAGGYGVAGESYGGVDGGYGGGVGGGGGGYGTEKGGYGGGEGGYGGYNRADNNLLRRRRSDGYGGGNHGAYCQTIPVEKCEKVPKKIPRKRCDKIPKPSCQSKPKQVIPNISVGVGMRLFIWSRENIIEYSKDRIHVTRSTLFFRQDTFHELNHYIYIGIIYCVYI